MGRFGGKVVLVTGGARNTGLEIVDLFLAEGAKVYFCTQAAESLKGGIAELERRGRTGFRGIQCSVADLKAVDAMMDVIEKEAGRLDVIVSNAANFGLGRNGRTNPHLQECEPSRLGEVHLSWNFLAP